MKKCGTTLRIVNDIVKPSTSTMAACSTRSISQASSPLECGDSSPLSLPSIVQSSLEEVGSHRDSQSPSKKERESGDESPHSKGHATRTTQCDSGVRADVGGHAVVPQLDRAQPAEHIEGEAFGDFVGSVRTTKCSAHDPASSAVACSSRTQTNWPSGKLVPNSSVTCGNGPRYNAC